MACCYRVKSASRSSRGSTAGVKGRSSHRLDGQGTQDRRVSAGDGAMAENKTGTGGRRRMGRVRDLMDKTVPNTRQCVSVCCCSCIIWVVNIIIWDLCEHISGEVK